MAIDTHPEIVLIYPFSALNYLNQVLALQKDWQQNVDASHSFESGINPHAIETSLQTMIDTSQAYVGWKMFREWKTESHTYIRHAIYDNTEDPLSAQSIEIKYEKDDRFDSYAYEVLFTGGSQPIQGFRIGYFPEFGEYRVATKINDVVIGYTFNDHGEFVYDPGGRTPKMSRDDFLIHVRFHTESAVVDYPLQLQREMPTTFYEELQTDARGELKAAEEAKGATFGEIIENFRGKEE